MNIAICDDDIEFCTTLKRQLTDCLQYNDIIDIYYSGEMFLAGCKKCNYDAVFLDLYMGGMTGFETAEKLAHCGKETDIIFLTSNDLMVYDSFEYQPFYFLRKAQYQQVLPKVISKLKGKLKQNGIVQFDIYGSSESIAVSSIIYIQSDNHYIIIHTNNMTAAKMSMVNGMIRFIVFICFPSIQNFNNYSLNSSNKSFNEFSIESPFFTL